MSIEQQETRTTSAGIRVSHVLWVCFGAAGMLSAASAVIAVEIVESRDDAKLERLKSDLSGTEEDLGKANARIQTLLTLHDHTIDAIADFETRISVLERSTTRIITHVAAPAYRAPAPAPNAASWYCFMSRDCYRKLDDCQLKHASNTEECRARGVAYCGGADGTTCYASEQDCMRESINANVMAGSPQLPKACVEVQ